MHTSEIGLERRIPDSREHKPRVLFFQEENNAASNERRLPLKGGFYILKATVFMYELVNCVYRDVCHAQITILKVMVEQRKNYDLNLS